MKTKLLILFIVLTIIACTSSKPIVKTATSATTDTKISDTIRIANEELEYEVIIIDPGFSTWLVTNSFPRNYYSQSYLENKNQFYVLEWNNRARQPSRYPPNLYEMTIDYNPTINYGYEVNYLIYNYMIYFQNTFKQQLNGYVPIR